MLAGNSYLPHRVYINRKQVLYEVTVSRRLYSRGRFVGGFSPEIVVAHGGAGHGGEAALRDLAGEAEDTPLSMVEVMDWAGVTHWADSPAAALVRDSAGGGDFLLVAEITAVLVTVVSVDAIATFAVVVFAILMGTSSVLASMGSDIRLLPVQLPVLLPIPLISNYGAY